MHLLALGLAYARKDITPALAFLLLERSRQEIVETIFGYRPTGLDRILRHLPDKVLSAHTYRKLIDLLNDGATATFLHHSKAITEAKLVGLHTLPPVAPPAGGHDDVRPSRRTRRPSRRIAISRRPGGPIIRNGGGRDRRPRSAQSSCGENPGSRRGAAATGHVTASGNWTVSAN